MNNSYYEKKAKLLETYYNEYLSEYVGENCFDLTMMYTTKNTIRRVLIALFNTKDDMDFSDIDFYIDLDDSYTYLYNKIAEHLKGE